MGPLDGWVPVAAAWFGALADGHDTGKGGSEMIVNSALLEHAAETLHGRRPRVTAAGVTVSASQCKTAARLLREAELTICNGLAKERPGFIEPDLQDDPRVLVFAVGILPSTTYRIDRRGRILEHTA